MADVLHKNMTDPDLHEPKGITTADANSLYTADGLGSGSWIVPDTIDPSDVAIPVGSTVQYAGSTPPSKWLLCYGQQISRSTYSDLFTMIGTAFGAGNGTTTFNLPDCRGRSIAGKDDMGGSNAARLSSITATVLGAVGGEEDHTLTAAECPTLTGTTSTDGAHTHTLGGATNLFRFTSSGGTGNGDISPVTYSSVNITVDSGGAHTHDVAVNTTSTSTSHINMQPSIIFNTIIYTGVA